MNKKLAFPIFCLLLIAVSLFVINGCGSNATGGGSSGGGGISGRQYYGMTSQGGTVKCTVNDTAFQLDFVAGGSMNVTTLTGTVTQLASGFVSCEITGSSPSDPNAKGTLYAYEVTNEVIVIGGGPDNGKVIMIAPAFSSTAPYPLAGSYESINIPRTDWIDPGNQQACMTGEITGTTSYKFEVMFFTVAGALKGSGSVEALQYTGDRLYKNDDTPQFFFSPKGLIAGINGKQGGVTWEEGGEVGVRYDSTVTVAQVAARNYIGMIFGRSLTNNETQIEMITVESIGVDSLKVSSMEVSSGAAIGSPKGTITLGAMGSPGQGIINATITGGIPAKMVAYKYQNTPDKYAVCVFASTESAMSFILIEK
jgi:hypothetical protein